MASFLGGLSWWELGKRSWHETVFDDVFGRAAQLAFYFLLALFPLLIFLLAIAGLLIGGTQIQSGLVNWLTTAMPGSASGLVHQVVTQTTSSSGNGKLSFGIGFALWSAAGGMAAVMSTLNVTFDVEERRSWIHQRWTALWLTVAMGFLMLISVAIILFGNYLATMLGNAIGRGAFTQILWKVVQWPIAIFLIVLAFGIVYRFAPDKEHPSWKWLTPGALVGTLLWLLASFGFREYLQFFNNYSATYGSLGALIILMMWFYVTGLAILIGGEVNSVVEAELAGRAGRTERKQPLPRAA